MDKRVIRSWLIEALLAFIVIIVPFFLAFMWEGMVPAIVSLWATALILMWNARKQNPDVKNKTRYQILEKFLYFQIINLSFALWLIFPIFTFVAIIMIIVLIILLIKTRKDPTPKIIKWAKYIGLHIFNWTLLLFLLGRSYEIINEAILVAMPIVTFINGMQAAFFIKLEAAMFKGKGSKKIIVLLIIIAMMVSTAFSILPR